LAVVDERAVREDRAGPVLSDGQGLFHGPLDTHAEAGGSGKYDSQFAVASEGPRWAGGIIPAALQAVNLHSVRAICDVALRRAAVAELHDLGPVRHGGPPQPEPSQTRRNGSVGASRQGWRRQERGRHDSAGLPRISSQEFGIINVHV